MLLLVGTLMWLMLAFLVYTLRKRMTYGSCASVSCDDVTEEPAAAVTDEEQAPAEEEAVTTGRSNNDAKWALISPPEADTESDEEYEDVEEGEEDEEGEEMEEAEEEETAAEEKEEKGEEGAEKPATAAAEKKAAPKKARETCKMQFIILNKGSKNTKLGSGALCDIVASLSVQNIIKIRELEGHTDSASLANSDPTRAEWLRAYRIWDYNGVTKITLRCDTREAFDGVVAKAAVDLKMPVTVKVFGPLTAVACIGPVSSDSLTDVTGELKLLS